MGIAKELFTDGLILSRCERNRVILSRCERNRLHMQSASPQVKVFCLLSGLIFTKNRGTWQRCRFPEATYSKMSFKTMFLLFVMVLKTRHKSGKALLLKANVGKKKAQRNHLKKQTNRTYKVKGIYSNFGEGLNVEGGIFPASPQA